MHTPITPTPLPPASPFAQSEAERLDRELALDRARNARRALAAVDPGLTRDLGPYRAPGVPQEPPSDVGHWTNE